MKKIILYMIMAIAGMIAVSCDKAIDEFDNSTNYIYFDMPFVLDQYGRKTTVREDSLMYSFAMDDLSVTEYTFKIPVNSVGLVTDQDRGPDFADVPKILETPYIPSQVKEKKSYAPYKYEIEMLKENHFNPDVQEQILRDAEK